MFMFWEGGRRCKDIKKKCSRSFRRNLGKKGQNRSLRGFKKDENSAILNV